jgi:hypothetical protein
MTADMDDNKPFNWRDHVDVHPAADLFPLMSEAELRELGEDIKKNGLQNDIVLCVRDDGDDGRPCLLDGRNRLDALAMAGMLAVDDHARLCIKRADGELREIRSEYIRGGDPQKHAYSLNLHRRHLTPEQRRELIGKLLTEKPEASDRQVAKLVKADHKTVAAVRAEKESTGEIPQLKKTVGADGKARRRPAKTAERNAQRKKQDKERREREHAQQFEELKRELAAKEEAEKRAIDLLVEHLKPEVLTEFIVCLRKCRMCVDKLEQAAQLKKTTHEAPAEPEALVDDDGLDIPDYLKRVAP